MSENDNLCNFLFFIFFKLKISKKEEEVRIEVKKFSLYFISKFILFFFLLFENI